MPGTPWRRLRGGRRLGRPTGAGRPGTKASRTTRVRVSDSACDACQLGGVELVPAPAVVVGHRRGTAAAALCCGAPAAALSRDPQKSSRQCAWSQTLTPFCPHAAAVRAKIAAATAAAMARPEVLAKVKAAAAARGPCSEAVRVSQRLLVCDRACPCVHSYVPYWVQGPKVVCLPGAEKLPCAARGSACVRPAPVNITLPLILLLRPQHHLTCPAAPPCRVTPPCRAPLRCALSLLAEED